jgi:hypothetical protein
MILMIASAPDALNPVAQPVSILLQTTRVGSAELLDIQDASVLQVDQQCAGMRDRGVACGCILGWRSQRGPVVGFSDEIRRALEAVSAGNRFE